MEAIIGILAGVAILIFKIISKSMSESAQSPVKPVMPAQPAQPEYFYEELNVDKKKQEENRAEGQRSVQPAPKAETETASKTKEKIDPKKLIVYSEIMNRKY